MLYRTALLAALAAGPATAQDPAEGAALFATYCVSCHGAEAQGDGPIRDLLTIPPADLTTLAARNDGAFPVFRVARQIDGRDPVMAHGGPMPFYGDVFDQGGSVILQDTSGQPIVMGQGIADLIAYLQELQEPI
ncbi:c-type cytochrome [Tranquillimonas alkanivorans]|uniref:Cytochrome c n=1 Tax=Tranquillimonas alkanivorans TaxID=441119 RepID=A0A1I5N6Z6_9RHOB|nr:cytochrome c [Tranquillimonas alkanivorans]SFP17504.1 Cytochrome c [Tranquillimonas alkanivorans]